jgi:parvulin-like peptidyl-prolyl isomerase
MTLERMIKRNVVRPSRVDPQALRSYYRQNREKFQRPAQVHARLILAAVDPQAGVAAELKAYEKIRKVYQEIQAGEDFALLAEQYSDDFYRVKGGDVGWMHRGRLEPDFEKVAFSLEVGKTSEPFRTAYGYNLMKVEGREPAQQMKFKEVRRALKAELEQKRMLELRRAWVEQLKKGAQVEILDEPSAPRASH